MSYNADDYIYFWKTGPFTNFFEKPFNYKGYVVYSSEQAFMLEKALTFDKSAVSAILSARRPDHVKRLGRKVKNYDDKVWDEIRYDKMVEVLRYKFAEPAMKKILLGTGDKILAEASPYDKIWGIGLDKSQAWRTPPQHWKGKNLLGKALMQVRDEFKTN